MSEKSTRIVLRGASAAVGDALGPVREFCAQAGVPAAAQHDLLVVVDEVVSNWLKYGRPDARAGEMEIQVGIEPGRLLLRFADTGPAFNPMEATPPDLDGPLAQRRIGGLGVHLVRALSASQRYARVGERNVLELALPFPA